MSTQESMPGNSHKRSGLDQLGLSQGSFYADSIPPAGGRETGRGSGR